MRNNKMSKKLLSITIDEELIEQLKNNSSKGKLSEYTEEVLRAGLGDTSAKDDFVELLKIAKRLNEYRKNGLIEFKGQWFGWDKICTPENPPQIPCLWGFWVVLSNEQLSKNPKKFLSMIYYKRILLYHTPYDLSTTFTIIVTILNNTTYVKIY